MELFNLLYNLGRWFGFLGFVFLTLLIFSGDTARFWDRFFGLDKIIKFQRKFALFTAFFVIFHPALFILSNRSVLNYIIPDFSVLPLALGITSFYIFIGVMFTSLIYKRISYTAWQYIHILTYVLFFFSIYHAFYWGSDSNNILIQVLYIVSFILFTIGVVYRTQYKIKKLYSGKFFVENVKWETKDTFTISIRPEKKIKFKPGQFCFLRLNKNNLHARHPFTIASSSDDNLLSFTIKNTGRFTETVSKLIKGEEILIDGPFGTFFVKDYKKDLVFIAGGVGITPFMSMIRNRISKDIKQNVLLFYSVKTKKDIIFRNELDSINKSWLKVVYILTRENDQISNDNFKYGYISKEIIQKYVKDLKNSNYYICGPKKLKDVVLSILTNLQVNKKNIYYEDFFW